MERIHGMDGQELVDVDVDLTAGRPLASVALACATAFVGACTAFIGTQIAFSLGVRKLGPRQPPQCENAADACEERRRQDPLLR